MIEVFDYYALGLDARKDVAELHKKAKSEYLKALKQSQQAKPGSEGAVKALAQRKLWEQAALLFSTAEGRKKYDEQLAAWQNSQEARNSKNRSEQEAQAFASAAETVLDLVARAWEEINKGNLVAARQVAAKAIRTDPSSWEAYLVNGIASYRQDDADEAMSSLRQAARLNPNSAAVFAGLGELYERLDNWQEAFSNYRKASILEPENTDFQVAMGLVCVKAEVPDEGVKYLRQALEREPEHPGANWALGVALAESARMGWSEVSDGHPRVPAGWYAMSREQALQAIHKLHEATSLRVEDPDLTKHLAELKSDVESNVKRHFNGNWVLLGLILVLLLLAANAGGAGPAIAVGLFASLYYVVNLVPQYATNARILAGDHALKRGFFNWLDNLTNPWIKLMVLSALFGLLPIFMVYWGIRNWTGQNAPLSTELKAIQGNVAFTAPTTSEEAAFDEKADAGAANATAGGSARPVPAVRVGRLQNTSQGLSSNAKLAVAGVVTLSVLAIVGFFIMKGKGSASIEAPIPQITQAPSQQVTGQKQSPAGRAALDPRWFGTWQTADGKKTLEISPQRLLVVTDEYKRNTADQTSKFELKWTSKTSLEPDQFGYTGKRTSAATIFRRYEEALAQFRKDPTDYSVTPSADLARQWAARMASGDYEELNSYLGGDDPGWHWIIDQNGNMLEISDGKYGLSLNLLTRTNSGVSASQRAQPQVVQSAATGGSIAPPSVRIGDSYTYETLDQIEPKMNNVTSREIVDVNPSGFVMKFVNAKSGYTRQLFYDSNLNLVSSRSGDNDGLNYSPALQYFKFPLRNGDTWTTSSTETNIKTGKTRTHTLRARVGGMERITVPAGTFDAIRITIESELNDQGQVSSGQDISWYAPEVRRTIVSELESRDAAGKVGRRRVNLIAYRLQ